MTVGMPGIEPMDCRIQVSSDGRTFNLGGDDKSSSLFVRDRRGLPVDQVVWLAGEPNHWWMLEGDAPPILGASQLAGAERVGFPLSIYPTPATWAASNGDGVCVIDWDMNLLHLFDGLDLDVGHLQLATARSLAQRLRDNFREYEPKIAGAGGGLL